MAIGRGDDVYHDGKKDKFRPPPVGAPVFFKFGHDLATVSQAFRKTYDDIYPTITKNTLNYSASDLASNPGHFHLLLVVYFKLLTKQKNLMVIQDIL